MAKAKGKKSKKAVKAGKAKAKKPAKKPAKKAVKKAAKTAVKKVAKGAKKLAKKAAKPAKKPIKPVRKMSPLEKQAPNVAILIRMRSNAIVPTNDAGETLLKKARYVRKESPAGVIYYRPDVAKRVK